MSNAYSLEGIARDNAPSTRIYTSRSYSDAKEAVKHKLRTYATAASIALASLAPNVQTAQNTLQSIVSSVPNQVVIDRAYKGLMIASGTTAATMIPSTAYAAWDIGGIFGSLFNSIKEGIMYFIKNSSELARSFSDFAKEAAIGAKDATKSTYESIRYDPDIDAGIRDANRKMNNLINPWPNKIIEGQNATITAMSSLEANLTPNSNAEVVHSYKYIEEPDYASAYALNLLLSNSKIRDTMRMQGMNINQIRDNVSSRKVNVALLKYMLDNEKVKEAAKIQGMNVEQIKRIAENDKNDLDEIIQKAKMSENAVPIVNQ